MEYVKHRIIKWLFSYWFGMYVFPFDRSTETILGMSEPERTEYFRQAKDLLDNRAYKQEIQELIRVYFQELAVKSESDVERTAYRLTIKALQDLDKRMHTLATQYHPPTVTKSLNRM